MSIQIKFQSKNNKILIFIVLFNLLFSLMSSITYVIDVLGKIKS
jgi:hypothetical protein